MDAEEILVGGFIDFFLFAAQKSEYPTSKIVNFCIMFNSSSFLCVMDEASPEG